MNTIEFLKQFTLIENHLYALEVNCDKRLGFLNLLKKLVDSKKISFEMATEICNIWVVRNEITRSSEDDLVDDNISKKLDNTIRILNMKNYVGRK